MLKIILPFLFAVGASAGSYTTDLQLYKPATGDTNYITPFANGMNTLDAAIPDKRVNKTAVFASSLTVRGPLTVAGSSLTVTGAASISGHAILATANTTSLTASSLTVTGGFSVGGSTLVVANGTIGIGMNPTSNRLEITGMDDLWATFIHGTGTAGKSLGLGIEAGTNASDVPFWIRNSGYGATYFKVTGAGAVTMPSGNFSVGGSTLVVANGMIGIGESPSVPLSVGGTFSKYGSLVISPVATAASGVQRAIGVAGTQMPSANSDELLGLAINQSFTNGGGYTSVAGYGVYVANPGGSVGVVSSFKGLYIETPAVGTTNHAVYSVGGNNYFGGNVGIADTAPQARLVVNGNIVSSGTVQAVNFVGSGVGLTGLPGGGDAVLAATQTFSGQNTFGGATSTTTFSGWIDIGLETITNACGAATSCTATCSSGKKVIGGGGFSNNAADYLYDSYPASNSTWNCQWTGVSGSHSTYAICARIK